MSLHLATPELDPTPPRPSEMLARPPHLMQATVRIETAHLANPALAVQRLLASEAGLFATVTGDDAGLDISVSLPDDRAATQRTALDWIRWVVHVAGVRGRLTW